MAGNANSGRKTNANEDLKLRVLDKAWVLLERALDDPEVPKKEKRDIALKLAARSVPTELTGNLNATITAMGTITKEGDVLRYDIGGETDPPKDS